MTDLPTISGYQARGWAIPGMLLAVLILVPPIVGVLIGFLAIGWLLVAAGGEEQTEKLLSFLLFATRMGYLGGWLPAVLTVAVAWTIALFRQKLTFWPMASVGLLFSVDLSFIGTFRPLLLPFSEVQQKLPGMIFLSLLILGTMGLVWWLGKLLGWVKRWPA